MVSPGTGPTSEDTPLNATRADSLAAIAQRLRPRLLACARRRFSTLGDADQEAEDVVQQVMLKVTQTDEARVLSPRAWLFAVTHRAAIDRLRALSREAKVELQDPADPAAETPEAILTRLDRARLARAAVEKLDEPYRSALRLRYLEGLAFPEIASRLETKERTARTWVSRGLLKLRQQMGGRA